MSKCERTLLLTSYPWKVASGFPSAVASSPRGTKHILVMFLCVGLKLSSLIWIPFPSFSLWSSELSAAQPASYYGSQGQGRRNWKKRLVTQAFSVFGHMDAYLPHALPLLFSFLMKMGFGLYHNQALMWKGLLGGSWDVEVLETFLPESISFCW